MLDTVVVPLLKIAVLVNALLVAVTFLVLMERKVIAWAQSRLGRCESDRTASCRRLPTRSS